VDVLKALGGETGVIVGRGHLGADGEEHHGVALGDLAVLLSYSSEHFAEDIPEIEETLCFEESIEKKTVTVYCIDREHTNPYRLYQRLGIKNSPSEEELRLLREEGKLKPLYKQSGKEPIKLKLTANCTYLILVK
jgi:ribosomal protein S25